MAGIMSPLLNGIRLALLGVDDGSSPYDQRILIGSKNLNANLGPPCIVLVPMGGEQFTGPEGPGQNPQTPVLASKSITFVAHCWGCANPSDPTDVYTQTEELADAVLTAAKDLAGAGNVHMVNEEWPESGHDAAGVILVRQFRIDGVGIERVALPLGRPITSDASQIVKVVGPFDQTAPYDDSGLPATDGSMGVSQ